MTDKEKEQLVGKLTDGRSSWSRSRHPINWFIRRQPRSTLQTHVMRRKVENSASLNVTRAIRPWDRRVDESTKQYAGFVHYRDAGVDRSLKGTADELGLGRSSVHTWARLFSWSARVRSYDEYIEKQERRITERARREMVERQARLGQSMTEKAQDAIDAGIIVPESVADVVRLADAGTRIERLARGESTENVAHGMNLILAHPLPPWAPEAAKQLVTENEFEGEDQDGRGNVIITNNTGTKTEA